MEIDFLIRQQNKLCPIEVKSTNTYTISSLLKFKKVFNKKIGKLFVLHNGDIKEEENIIYYLIIWLFVYKKRYIRFKQSLIVNLMYFI